MTFKLEQLGSYRIERTSDWGNDPNKTFGEMIRVKGSKPKPPFFDVPSHVYKFSDKELCLYLHERKNKWRALSRSLNVPIDISDPEISIRFPVLKFGEVSKIIPFVRKSIRKTPYTEDQRRKLYLNFHKGRPQTPKGIELNGSNLNKSIHGHNSIPYVHASEGKLMPDNPFNPDYPIKGPNPSDPDTEDDQDPIDEPYLPSDPGNEPETDQPLSLT
jgi:hypothetical protein